MNIEDIKKKILDHDKKLNYEEIKKLEELREKIRVFIEKFREMEEYIKELEKINIIELSGNPKIKEDELEILYKAYSLYSELSNSFSDFYKKLIEYYMLLEREII